MQIPDTIKIGAINWKVKRVPAADIDCEMQIPGSMSEMTQTIRIAEGLTPEMEAVVFIHEILHCMDSELNHDIVDFLANAFYQVLKENELNFRE